jgi:hypothetical protein
MMAPIEIARIAASARGRAPVPACFGEFLMIARFFRSHLPTTATLALCSGLLLPACAADSAGNDESKARAADDDAADDDATDDDATDDDATDDDATDDDATDDDVSDDDVSDDDAGTSSMDADGGSSMPAQTDSGAPSNTPGSVDGIILYSDQVGLYSIVGGTTKELGTGTDYRVLTNLRLSPDGLNLMYTVDGSLRIASTLDGSFTVPVQQGFVPISWLSNDTAIATQPGADLAYQAEVVELGLDESTTPLFDSDMKEYCAASEHALSPDADKIIMRCGFGLNGELVIGDFTTMGITTHGETKITTSGTPPIWTANDHIVHVNSGGDVEINTPAFDDPVVVTGVTDALLAAGPNAVLAIGTTTGEGGMNINTYRVISVPSGDVEELTWLADINPPFAKVAFNDDGSRVLFAEGTGIAHAKKDGSDKVVVKEPGMGLQNPALQSLTW